MSAVSICRFSQNRWIFIRLMLAMLYSGPLYVGTCIITEERICWRSQETGEGMKCFIFWMILYYCVISCTWHRILSFLTFNYVFNCVHTLIKIFTLDNLLNLFFCRLWILGGVPTQRVIWWRKSGKSLQKQNTWSGSMHLRSVHGNCKVWSMYSLWVWACDMGNNVLFDC